MRFSIWICRFGAFAIGLVAGALYLIPHSHPFRQDDHGMFVPVDPHADVVALVVVAGVTCWLLVSLAIARHLEKPRSRLVPGLTSGVIAGVVAMGASRVGAWPITTADAAIVFGIGALGSVGVLVIPGSLRTDSWTRASAERE